MYENACVYNKKTNPEGCQQSCGSHQRSSMMRVRQDRSDRFSHDSKSRTQDAGLRIQDSGSRTTATGSATTQDPELRMQDSGSRTQDSRLSIQDSGSRARDPGLRIQDRSNRISHDTKKKCGGSWVIGNMRVHRYRQTEGRSKVPPTV